MKFSFMESRAEIRHTFNAFRLVICGFVILYKDLNFKTGSKLGHFTVYAISSACQRGETRRGQRPERRPEESPTRE